VTAAALHLLVRLPWPDKRLSPNAREHYYDKSEIVRAHRETAWAATLELSPPPVTWERIKVSYHFRPPDKHHRDADNMHGMCKSYIDGIFDALKLNDERIKESHQYVYDKTDKLGEVVIVLEEQKVIPTYPIGG